jgi:hypothetical protein
MVRLPTPLLFGAVEKTSYTPKLTGLTEVNLQDVAASEACDAKANKLAHSACLANAIEKVLGRFMDALLCR